MRIVETNYTNQDFHGYDQEIMTPVSLGCYKQKENLRTHNFLRALVNCQSLVPVKLLLCICVSELVQY